MLVTRKCESCQVKQPNYGMPAEGKARWCAGCAKAYTGAVDVKHPKCEGCGLKEPSLCLPADGRKRRWCADCAPEATHLPLTISGLWTSVQGQISPGNGNPYDAAEPG